MKYLSLLHILGDQVSHFILEKAHNFPSLSFIADFFFHQQLQYLISSLNFCGHTTISNRDDLIFCNVSTLVQALKTNQRLHRKTLPYTVKNPPSP